MRTDLFNFELPADRIALRPASPRDAARLLVVRPGAALECEDRRVRDLPELLRPGDQLVVNDTKVIAAQLHGRRLGRGPEAGIEATLIKRLDGARWQALVKPARKLAVGDVVRFGAEGSVCFLEELDAAVEAKGDAGEITFAFAFHGPALDTAIAARGEVPLPPYIAARRPTDEQDRADYQTMFAREEGAVAAPTAGLHFTPELLERCDRRGIPRTFVTLHVGIGTFRPISVERLSEHTMHAEWCELSPAASAMLNDTRAVGGRIIAVGTTSVRTLETAFHDGQLAPWSGPTRIFIRPPYQFGGVDCLLTNFHLPRSTLFVLVSALAGLELIQRAYAEAVRERYRFYSYGDAMLIV
jgi:S-adenosylmethionine:tRNA ribosyltransferase-isomerase